MTTTPTSWHTRGRIFHATVLVLLWGVWGACSALPATPAVLEPLVDMDPR